jgi:uncharacterized membrane protein YgdD (TMEM256/DUF423 family)
MIQSNGFWNSRRALIAGGVAALLSVVMGAFGAHALKEHLTPERLQVFETAVRYQMLHGLALILLGQSPQQYFSQWTARLFVVGLVLFCGSLILLVLTDTPMLGAITPFGGVAWILGWILWIQKWMRTSEST